MSVFLPPGKIKETLVLLPRTLIGILGIIVLTAACSTNPAKPAPTSDTAANEVSKNELAANEKELVCHYVTGTGSNIPRKVCAFEKTWDKYNKKTRENAEEFSRRNRETGALTAPATAAEQAVGRGTITGPMSP